MIAFHIPGDARGWQRTGHNGAQHYNKPETRAFQAVVRLAASEAMAGAALIEGAVELTLTTYVQPPKSMSKKRRELALAQDFRPTKKPDSDNLAKTIMDACNKIVWRDDVQVSDLHVRRRWGETPGVDVTVRPA